MSHPAAQDTKQQVRQAIDIVDLVGGYLDLRRQGRNYVALCPWHDDTRPSLNVNPERQSWKCWVCDVGGDIFSFVMQREGVDFRQALSMLAERAGISLDNQRRSGPAAKPGSPEDKQTLYNAMAWAERQFHQCLLSAPEAHAARQYLAGRGITLDSIERFHIGFSPDSWQWILDRAGGASITPPVLEAVGLAARSPKGGRLYDRFKGRVMFPIRDTQSRTIAFGGRVLPELADERAAKYVNSPETRLFSKSDQLYALDVVRDSVAKSRQVVVVEGYTDAVIAAQHGLDNVVAVLGTALGPRHVRLLRRFADTITLVLDGDEAGQRRTNEILQLFIAEQVDLRVLTLPEGLDPCDFLLQRGVQAWQEMLDGAPDALEHQIHTLTRELDTANDLHGANRALEEILATMAQAPRLQPTTTTSIRLREQQVLTRLARDFHMDETELRQRLKELRQAAGRRRGDSAQEENRPTAVKISAKEAELLEILCLKPQLVPEVLEAIPVEWLPSEPTRKIFAVYSQILANGEYADFDRVMTELEDAQLKNLLATLDTEAHAKAVECGETPEARLEGLLSSIAHRRDRHELSSVHQGRLEEDQALSLVQNYIQQERDRQGISAPTDG